MPRPLKVALIVVGSLIGGFVLLGVIGAQFMVLEEPETAAPTSTTTGTTVTLDPIPGSTKPPTIITSAPTTIAIPPPTTTEAPMTVEDCLAWEAAEVAVIFEMGDALGEMAAAMAVGDADMASSWYWHAKGKREVLYFEEWLAECGHWNPATAERAAADYAAAEEAWRGVEGICREALEPLGMAC